MTISDAPSTGEEAVKSEIAHFKARAESAEARCGEVAKQLREEVEYQRPGSTTRHVLESLASRLEGEEK